MNDFVLNVGFKSTTCCYKGCGVQFAMTSEFYKSRLTDHADFCCPNGHHQHFTEESDEERAKRFEDKFKTENSIVRKLEDILITKDNRINDLSKCCEHKKRSIRAYRGLLTRAKNK